ncbi:hypothetical protein PN466_06480 [Roseofilum reptotaenium CS-1145]|nr:hypothetical protein [Roseofilum reptotaenium CS-1145]
MFFVNQKNESKSVLFSLQKFCIVQEMLDAQNLDVMGDYRFDR